jgi:thioester reductase-like protein/aryl carrier-like protein
VIDDLSRDQSLLEFVASKLKYLYYVGGSLPQASGDLVCEKLPVYQSLGSSECAIFPLLRPHEDQTFVDWNYVQIHPSLQAEFQYRFEDLYELVVIKKKDYEYLQPVFVHFPELEQYETRDLFTPHRTKRGLWKHESRIDDVIVFINGEKTNPVSFEHEVASHPEVRSALVAGQKRFEASLLVEPVDPKPLGAELQKEFIERIWPIIQSANTKSPAHARVSKSKILLTDPEIPMLRAGKGTVMRKATLTAYQNKLDDLYSAANKSDSNAVVDFNDCEAVIRTVHELVKYVTEWDHLENDDDFFSLGMDSLQVLRLIWELKVQFSKGSLTPGAVYTNPSVNLLAEVLSKSLIETHDTKVNLQETRYTALSGLRHKYEEKIDSLAESASSRSKPTGGQASAPPVILLTGSTGSLGSYILQSLLLDDTVAHIYCLNRSRDPKSLQEARNAERQLPADFPPSRVTFLASDISMPGFGMDRSIYDKMLSTATHIIHNAWPVNFNQALQSFQPSLDGVFGLISFSTYAKHSPAVLFLSSISSVINYHNAPGTEPVIPETVLSDDYSPAPMGYGESKYIAERMLDYAARRLHLTTGAVRVGQIAGTAHNPRGWSRNEWLPSLVLSSRYIGAVPDSLGPKRSNLSGVSNINWVPIDLLAGIIVELTFDLSQDKISPGMHVYHAINPHPIAWDSLLPTVKSILEDTLSVEPAPTANYIKIIPLQAWIEHLQSTGAAVTGSGISEVSADVVYRNPGIKLLDFYKSLLNSDESAPSCTFDIRKTSEASQSLKILEPIRLEWMASWVKNWIASLK